MACPGTKIDRERQGERRAARIESNLAEMRAADRAARAAETREEKFRHKVEALQRYARHVELVRGW